MSPPASSSSAAASSSSAGAAGGLLAPKSRPASASGWAARGTRTVGRGSSRAALQLAMRTSHLEDDMARKLQVGPV
eukprot:496069-Prymnesium_polylepis.1